MWQDGKWKKGKKIITGRWFYDWADKVFYINLNSKDPITGEKRKVKVFGDHPEFNGWKLVRE